MALEYAFRLSTYLTLGLACLCLGYAELAYLPVISAFTAVVGVMVVIAYIGDLRGQHMSNAASNWMGGVIAAIVGLWVAYQCLRPNGLMESMQFPANMLPSLAPVLMILVPAKLFRPKSVVDYWALQGIGLMSVAMGCAMAQDAIFGLLLIAYIICSVWSMTLFYLYRAEAGHLVPVVERPPARPFLLVGATPLPAGSRLPLSALTSRWAMVALGLALLLFLSTPRTGGSQWELHAGHRSRLETGAPEAGSVDLNRSGRLNLSSDLAFEAQAEYRMDHGQTRPWNDLDIYGQRWRGAGLNYYAGGTWKRVLMASVGELDGNFRRRRGDSLPVVRNYPPVWPPLPEGLEAVIGLPDQNPALVFTIAPQVKLGQATYLAEPITSLYGTYGPVVSLIPRGGTVIWRRLRDGSVQPTDGLANDKTPYQQLVLLNADRDRSNYIRLEPSDVAQLRTVPDGVRERLKPWTSTLLRRLLPKLQPDHLRPEIDLLLERGESLTREHYEPVARLLQEHLARSGEFTYSLNLRRERWDIDPTEDFLYHIRSGHCERYAGGLALMLRTLGVPCQVVLGYRGCEPRKGAPGEYIIRQSHMHAWTEVLVPPRPAPSPSSPVPIPGSSTGGVWYPPEKDANVWQWLSVDATPSDDATPTSELAAFGEWLDGSIRWVQDLFRQFIVDYDVSRRDKAGSQLWESFWTWVDDTKARLWRGDPLAWAVLLGILMGSLLGLRVVSWLRQQRRAARLARRALLRSRQGFQQRLLVILSRWGLVPRPVQTAQEFAEAIRPDLLNRQLSEDLAAIPGQSARLHYRECFGGLPISEADRSEIETAIDRLAAVPPRRV
jgi:transglutaminase-like putative cysteine protease